MVTLSEARKLNAQFSDQVLLFQLGDFYEVLGDKAAIVARQLGLTLVTRGHGENELPMCGFPYHQLDTYLEKLIKLGHRVSVIKHGQANETLRSDR